MAEELKSKKPGSKKLIIAVIAALAVIIGVGTAVVYSSSPARNLGRQIDLGNRYLEELNYEQAVSAFEEALRIDPLNTEAQEGLVQSYSGWTDKLASDGNIAGTVDLYQAASESQYLDSTYKVELKEHVVDLVIDAAEKKKDEENYDEAIELYEEAEELAEGDEDAAERIKEGKSETLVVRAENADWDERITAWEDVIENDPSNVDAYYTLIDLCYTEGNVDLYEETIRRGAEATGDAGLVERLEYLDWSMSFLRPFPATEAFSEYKDFRRLYMTGELSSSEADDYLQAAGWIYIDMDFYLDMEATQTQHGVYRKDAFTDEYGYTRPMFVYFGENGSARYVDWTEGFGG